MHHIVKPGKSRAVPDGTPPSSAERKLRLKARANQRDNSSRWPRAVRVWILISGGVLSWLAVYGIVLLLT